MENKVLVLGAGAYQVPLIETAKECGFGVIAASIPGNYPGFSIADEGAYIDTRDAAALCELAKERGVRAVVTAGTDVAISSVGFINETLGLHGINAETGYLTTDKIAMKEAFSSNGVTTARFVLADRNASLDDLKKIVEERIGLPAIFKAIDSSGSRGITKVYSLDEVQGAYQAVIEVSNAERFLIEECLEGVEFGVQLFVKDSELLLFMTHGDYLFDGSGTSVPLGHYAPYGSEELNSLARRECEKLIKAVKITSGAVNVDAMFCNGKVYILEVGARSGATGLAELVSLQYGFDYYRAIIKDALGLDVEVPRAMKERCSISMLLGADKPGRVAKLSVPDIAASDSIEQLVVDFSVGDEIRKFNVGSDRLGLITASGTSLDELEKQVYEEIDCIECFLDDGRKVEWVRGHE